MIKKFLTPRSVAGNIFLALILSVLLFFLTLLFLNLFTRHGQTVKVPDLHGKSLDEASRLLEDNSLRYEIVDSIYSEDVAPGVIIDYTPSVGAVVKPERLIFLTINATSPRQVAIPNVKDASERQAMATLHSLGFEQISKKVVPASYDALAVEVRTMGGKVLTPGMRISINTPIVLVVTRYADAINFGDSLHHSARVHSDSLSSRSGAESEKRREELKEDESWF